MSVVVRDATKEDCHGLVDLIKELADYENMSKDVKITPEVLERDGFGDNPIYRCAVAEAREEGAGAKTRGRLVGYAMYFFTYSTFQGRTLYMEDIFVTPEHRGRGVGTRMWRHVAQFARDNGCVRMDFVVLKWNTSVIEYYKRHGCTNLSSGEHGWEYYRLPNEAMHKLADGQ